MAFTYASDALKNNREFILAAVSEDQSGCLLSFVSEVFRADCEIILDAVKKTGIALEHASKELQDNYQIVLAAVIQFGWAFEFASIGLRDNKKIALEAFSNWMGYAKLEGFKRYVGQSLIDDADLLKIVNDGNLLLDEYNIDID